MNTKLPDTRPIDVPELAVDDVQRATDCQSDHAKTTGCTRAADTRLNAAMRALLAIIAGLIVSDILKCTVAAISGGATTRSQAWASALIFLAAIVFILRVLTDNVLYYNDPDVVTRGDAYLFRIAVIVCDLVSYGFCYAIVARLANTPTTGVRNDDLTWMIGLFFGVELLHFGWCLLALETVRHEPSTDSRKPLLAEWKSLSGTWAVVWLFATAGLIAVERLSSEETTTILAAITVFGGSIVSAWHYLSRLREHYMGRAIRPSIF